MNGLRIIALIILGLAPAWQAWAACPVPQGDWDYCTLCGPCVPDEGDCDMDSECQEGLTCETDVGPEYGWAKGVDVCTGTPTSAAKETIDDSEPATDIECTGLALLLDPACLPTEDPEPVAPDNGTCAFPVGHPDYCFSCGPCTEGQGGCNRNYQCAEGLICDLTTNTCVQLE